jgi:hypothetical protein
VGPNIISLITQPSQRHQLEMYFFLFSTYNEVGYSHNLYEGQQHLLNKIIEQGWPGSLFVIVPAQISLNRFAEF